MVQNKVAFLYEARHI